ncbi:gamma-glutamyl-gamma-aminobutyrate hydrolase family protein [Lysinibacter sp. HNR]|uniref:gamma-glutamyl-gamma-aminobutyrate hydrolase family protein n=1 Tax=Lysinibacter sp. HNR TaxID=3031408 RepID=UPI002435C117|nr:gamma-glutamyl-gamma-aminobutyrate hydrolase family protein [Lysinibacter sp. HNR]WGD37203.1 gamma-glutamyl-gamma-aminobutyrate hydrolase family protein [Lysinibacter sp. HNR]
MNDSREQDAQKAPVIGLTTYLERAQMGVWDTPAAFLPRAYFSAINRAGGSAVLLPPQPCDRDTADQLCGLLDGIVFVGGADINPALYGQEAHPRTDAPRVERDSFEVALLSVALEYDLPVLGICRGAQMLNTVLGGTLVQHLPEHTGSNRYQQGEGKFNTVPVSIHKNSLLESILGSQRPGVPVYHHQAIDRVAGELAVTALSDDGIIQAVEMPSKTFVLGVQWHPEQDADHDDRLFAALIGAATRYHGRHSPDGQKITRQPVPHTRQEAP